MGLNLIPNPAERTKSVRSSCDDLYELVVLGNQPVDHSKGVHAVILLPQDRTTYNLDPEP